MKKIKENDLWYDWIDKKAHTAKHESTPASKAEVGPAQSKHVHSYQKCQFLAVKHSYSKSFQEYLLTESMHHAI